VPVTREELHHRRIDMRGYRRSDGLYEIEGRVTDRKPHDFTPPGFGSRLVPAGGPIHDMGVALVYDMDFLVHDVRTFSDAYPYRECASGGVALQSLKGLRIAGGWSREIKARLGGGAACTHLAEILIPLGTVAIQTLSVDRMGRPDTLDAQGRPIKIDSCYAYRETGEIVLQQWPQWHRPATPKS